MNLAASDRAGTRTFYQNNSNLDLSTFELTLAEKYIESGQQIEECEIVVEPLADICSRIAPHFAIDFLKIDTEGHEIAVIKGHDFEKFPVRVLVAESSIGSLKYLVECIEAQGMEFLSFDGLNAWFVSRLEVKTLRSFLEFSANPILDWYHPWVYIQVIEERNLTISRLSEELNLAGAKANKVLDDGMDSNLVRRIDELESLLKLEQDTLSAFRESESYRFGRFTTWPVRTLKGFFKRLQTKFHRN